MLWDGRRWIGDAEVMISLVFAGHLVVGNGFLCEHVGIVLC
jgi:hypothetical protein